jgi:hypothetical protein
MTVVPENTDNSLVLVRSKFVCEYSGYTTTTTTHFIYTIEFYKIQKVVYQI